MAEAAEQSPVNMAEAVEQAPADMDTLLEPDEPGGSESESPRAAMVEAAKHTWAGNLGVYMVAFSTGEKINWSLIRKVNRIPSGFVCTWALSTSGMNLEFAVDQNLIGVRLTRPIGS